VDGVPDSAPRNLIACFTGVPFTAAWCRLKDGLYKKDRVVYAKPPFGGAEQVFNYLGRYTHRIAISNGCRSFATTTNSRDIRMMDGEGR
jgi:hypothetical protein